MVLLRKQPGTQLLRCPYLYVCTSKASKLSGNPTKTWQASGAPARSRQYSYFCTSKSSKLRGKTWQASGAPASTQPLRCQYPYLCTSKASKLSGQTWQASGAPASIGGGSVVLPAGQEVQTDDRSGDHLPEPQEAQKRAPSTAAYLPG